MPSNLLSTDAMFPRKGKNTDETLNDVLNYLYMLREQLRYNMANLGAENFNDASLDEFAVMISKPVYGKIEDLEGNVAQLSLTSKGLVTRVEDAENNIGQLTVQSNLIAMQVNDASFLLGVINGQSVAMLDADVINFSAETLMLSGKGGSHIVLAQGNLMIDSDNFSVTTSGIVTTKERIGIVSGNNGELTFLSTDTNVIGRLSYSWRTSSNDYALYLQTANNYPLKLYSDSNMSIDVKASKTLYIGTVGANTITIGNASSNVNIVGTVKINGVTV